MRLIIKIFSVFLIFIAIYCLSIFILIKYDYHQYVENIPKSVTGGYGYSLKRFQEADTTYNIDLLFVGSSHSYRSFDPKIFELNNISTFNLGSSQQTPINSYYLLEEYLPQMKPKKVFIECFWRVLQVKDKGIESSLDLVSNKRLSLETLKMVAKSDNHLVYNAFIYQFINRIFNPLSTEKQNNIPYNNYKGRGYVESTRELKIQTLNSLKEHAWTYKDHQLRYLQKCIEICKKFKAEPVLVMTPVTEEFLNSATNHPELFQRLRELANSNGVMLLNYNDNFYSKLNSLEHFYDPNHLNYQGVTLFSEALIKDIVRHNILELPDSPVFSYQKNLLSNSNFSKEKSLDGWKLIGESFYEFTEQGINIQSSGDLIGFGQFVLNKDNTYNITVDITDIKEGSLAIFNYNKKMFTIDEPGEHTFNFTADYPSIYFYRDKGNTNLTISKIEITNTTFK